MLRSIKILGRLGFLGCLGLLVSCNPRVATSFWRIGTPADSLREGYAILTEGSKVRHCYPINEWTDTMPNYVGKGDTYHQLHHHGVAVESELMAYRIYFDKKQTIDPYCKKKPQLELAHSYWYPNDSHRRCRFCQVLERQEACAYRTCRRTQPTDRFAEKE